MSQICSLCGKLPQVGNKISHANNKTRRRFNPNLQNIRVFKDGYTRRMKICTRCIRSGKVIKFI